MGTPWHKPMDVSAKTVEPIDAVDDHDSSPPIAKRLRSSVHTHGVVRTQADAPVSAEMALRNLKDGNLRYVEGKPLERRFDADARQALAQYGQSPFATVIGCADSRCPCEILFDAQPGDLFVLRNAGNTCTHGEGSIVGSLEYSVGHLHTKFILVLGHTRCGAIAGATSTAMNATCNPQSDDQPSTLHKLLGGLRPVVLQAMAELSDTATCDEVAAHAIRVNIFHTMEKLLTYSEPLREKVRSGEVSVQGAVYDIHSGMVEFLGASPKQSLILGTCAEDVVPKAV